MRAASFKRLLGRGMLILRLPDHWAILGRHASEQVPESTSKDGANEPDGESGTGASCTRARRYGRRLVVARLRSNPGTEGSHQETTDYRSLNPIVPNFRARRGRRKRLQR